ncbi:MAG: RagB/SusD family nutrient uptake outer membrane protein, partial [Bacteroidota bacterium]
SCEDLLEETNPSNITDDNYFTEENVDELVTASYQALRGLYQQYNLAFQGTDIFTSKNEIIGVSALNEYVNITASITGYWNPSYNLISRANVAINRYNQIEFSNPANQSMGIAEASALRALAYFELAQQYGGVPIILEEVTTIRADYSRATEEEVYAQIINDLNAAIPNLSDDVEVGRITQRAAKHLLAKVYLTRGYLSFGSASDFTEAARLAEEAIGGYDIRTQTFAAVFDIDNQQNPEILFSVQYERTTNTDDYSNTKHGLMMFSVDQLPGISRGNPYGAASNANMPTDYFYNLFAENDTREVETIHRVLYADQEGEYVVLDENGNELESIPIEVGDTVIYFPKTPLSNEEIANRNYWVYNPGWYYRNDVDIPNEIPGYKFNYVTNQFSVFPIFKKFDDVEIDAGENGSRDTYVFRIAETHLIAAEAYLQAGNQANALQHINIVRERATGETNFYSGTLTIDDILEESALELAGEDNRWNTLKRTGKLGERINLYNPHVQDHGQFDPSIHLLRPIPESEILLSDGSLVQNNGY